MIRKLLNFTKVEHTAFSVPLIFTGAWMGAGKHWPPLATVFLIMVAAVGARIFGMALNRIFDRAIDAANPRTAGREMPSGVLTLQTALMVAGTGLLTYLTACYLLGPWCLYLSPLPLIPLLGYSLLKRFTALCHFGIGLCLALAPLGAYVAAAGQPRFRSDVFLFCGFVFFWLSGADIIYALMDIDSDRRNGIYSLPAILGASNAQVAAAIAHIAALICLLTLLILDSAGATAYTAFAATVLLFIPLYLPSIPVAVRFFPMATIAGIAGAITPLLG
jgi:4-hydroxybenzoate polyprenyltransferase